MSQSTLVKYFRHSDTGAPTLTGAPGAIQAVLNACLVTGYNVSAVDSITRDGTTVTVTVSAGHGLEQGVVVAIAGADQAEYNGEHRITTTTASTFEFELPESQTPATPATGTIECRQAPAGWERAFVSGDSQRAAFRSTAVDATGFYLYVDDTNNQGTRRTGVKGYESMTDIDTGANPFPYSPEDDQWVWWYKGGDETTARDWALIADDRLFWLYVNEGSHRLCCCGDLISYLPVDNFCCVVGGSARNNDNAYFAPVAAICEYNKTTTPGFYLARDWGGVGGGAPITTAYAPELVYAASNPLRDLYPRELGGNHNFAWPPTATGGVISMPISYVEIDKSTKAPTLRAQAPGLRAPGHDEPFAVLEIIENGISPARNYLVVPARAPRNTDNYNPQRTGQMLIDITGPWR